MGGLLYTPPQYGAGGTGGDVGNAGANTSQLAQLALAVKSAKMQEDEQKRTKAKEGLSLLGSNPVLMMMANPKDVEKMFKEGYGLSFTADKIPNPQATQNAASVAQATPPTSGGPEDSFRASLNAVRESANSMQGNQAGAQAGSPPSADAAKKAPGGGVSPADLLGNTASQAFGQKFGALAPLYGQAMSQVELEQVKQQGQREIAGLQSEAAGNGPGAWRAMGKLYMLSGKQLKDEDMRSILAVSSDNPEIVHQALQYALGAETPADKAKRLELMFKSITGSKELMEKFKNPTDAFTYAQSIVETGQIPNIAMKPMSVSEATKMAETRDNLIDRGVPFDIAYVMAYNESLGQSLPVTMPPGFQSIPQQKAATERITADAKASEAATYATQVKEDATKIAATLALSENQALDAQVRAMIEARAKKTPFPKEVEEGILAKVGSTVGLQSGHTKSWYQWLTGGETQTFTRIPDKDAAKKGAVGDGPSTPTKKKKDDGFTLDNYIIDKMFNQNQGNEGYPARPEAQ